MTDFGRQIGLGDFDQRVGKSFTVEADGQEVPLVLRACQALPNSQREGGGFRLEFAGPRETPLDQGLFSFRIDEDAFGIFIVPIGETGRSRRYEAVFF